MRLITWKRLEQWSREHADARHWLDAWGAAVIEAEWKNLGQVRETYPHADEVIVESERPVTVFNVRGNRYRMITAIHYNTQCVYAMRFMAHAEYSKDQWKKTL